MRVTTPERWSVIVELFARAIDLPGPDRARFLDAACAEDTELRAELEALLASAPGAADALQHAIARGAARLGRESHASALGRRLGPYRLRDVIGEGGMGTVFRATRDDAEYHREVAIKLLRPVGASPLLAAKFRAERQVLASLDHPGIVRLLDGGSTDDGVPYLVMELITGVPLAVHAQTLSVAACVRLVAAIAGALQYAHQKLVVHCDVKPSNVIVDAAGTPRLLDFGIARLLAPELGESALTATPLFTAEYASPEQVRGDPVSVASDVYSIGAVLYELVTGQPPQRRGATLVETLANICDREPPRPSAIAEPARRRELAGDLDSILAKALRKAPGERYASAAQLVADLERYLGGLPVLARPPAFGDRARKFVRRNRGRVALVALVGAALASATTVSILQARRADRHAAAAERDRRNLLRERGVQELARGHATRALPFLAEALRAGDDTPALRLVLAEAMRPLSRGRATVKIAAGTTGIAWAPDGRSFAVTEMAGHVAIYDLDGAGRMRAAVGAVGLDARVFSPDGADVAARDLAGHVYVWDATTGAPRFTFAAGGGGGHELAYTAAGDTLVTALDDGRAFALDARTGAVRQTVRIDVAGSRVKVIALSPDDRHVAIGAVAGSIDVWDLAGDHRVRRLAGHAGEVSALRFSRDGSRLYSGGADHTLRVWDAETGASVTTLGGQAGAITAIELDPGGARIATASTDNTAAIRDARSGAILVMLAGVQFRRPGGLRYSPDGMRLVSAGGDGAYRIWDAGGNPELVLDGTPGAGGARHSASDPALDARFSPAGAHLLTASPTEVRVWRVDRAPLLADLALASAPYTVAWSPDETRLAVVGRKFAGIWDVASLRAVAAIEVGDVSLWDTEWSPDGARIAIAGDAGIAAIHDARGARVGSLAGHAGTVYRIAWSPDGRRLVTTGADRTARIWDASSGAQLRVLAHGAGLSGAAWRRDGAEIVTATSRDHLLHLWDAASGARRMTIDSHGMLLLHVAFSPDGRSIVASSVGGEVAVWDRATGTRRLSLEGHTDSVPVAAWSPDGGLIATAGYDRTLRLWDPATGAQLATRATGPLMHLAWSRDSTRIACASDDGHVTIWDVHRATESVPAILGYIADHVPFQLVDGQLARRPLTGSP